VIDVLRSKVRKLLAIINPFVATLNGKQITLNQKSLYIIPTKIIFGLLLVVTILALIAINYQNNLVYLLVFVLVVAFFNTMIFTHRNLEKITITNMGCSDVFAEQECAFKIKVKASKIAHQAIKLHFYKTPDNFVLLHLTPNQDQTINLLYKASKRGVLIPPKIRVETRFPLGLFVCWGYCDLNFKSLVYPKPLRTELNLYQNFSAGDENSNEITHNFGADDFLGLDNYQVGDSKRRLDWKAYSRGQGLRVKKFGSSTGSNINLDFNELSGDVENRLSVLCYLVLELTKQNLSFALNLPQQEISLNSGLNHQEECLKALALYGLNNL